MRVESPKMFADSVGTLGNQNKQRSERYEVYLGH